MKYDMNLLLLAIDMNKDVKHGVIGTAGCLGRLLMLKGWGRLVEREWVLDILPGTHRVLDNIILHNRIKSKIYNLVKT